jgi:hypothetical protein
MTVNIKLESATLRRAPSPADDSLKASPLNAGRRGDPDRAPQRTRARHLGIHRSGAWPEREVAPAPVRQLQAIKRALGPTKSVGAHAGVYRSGHAEPSISCAVLAGADLTVSEPSSGNIKFAKYQEFDSSVFKTKDQEAPAR